MKSHRIVVVGSSNTDLIMRVPRFPAPGETVLATKFMTAAGGKGANQAVAAARAGGKITFVGRVGADAYAQHTLANLRHDGINVRFVGRDLKSPSGMALILVAQNGENSIAAANGANGRLSIADIQKASAAISLAGLLLVQLEVPLPAVALAIELAEKKGIPVILNPAPGRPLPSSLLKKVAFLTPNETECEILTGVKVHRGEKAARRAAEMLLNKGVRNVVLTLGGRGAYVASREIRKFIPGFVVKAVDTTAAGDVFNGALAVALLEEKGLLDAVRFAHAAAAISVTRAGAQPSAPTRREIDRFLAKARKSGLA